MKFLIIENSPFPIIILLVGLGGLEVTFSLRDPRFAGSNPTAVDGFFQDVQIIAQILLEGFSAGGPRSEISGSLKDLKPEKIGP